MLYIQQSLTHDEEIVHVGQYHWMYTVQAFANVIWGALGSILAIVGAVYAYKQLGHFPPRLFWLDAVRYLHPGIRIFAFVIFILGVMNFAQMMVVKATSEIAVTNKRLVYKTGLIARQVGEIGIDRIEGVNIAQSILGRMFGYGRIVIHGLGVGQVTLPPMDDPIAFRKAIEKARFYRRGQEEEAA